MEGSEDDDSHALALGLDLSSDGSGKCAEEGVPLPMSARISGNVGI